MIFGLLLLPKQLGSTLQSTEPSLPLYLIFRVLPLALLTYIRYISVYEVVFYCKDFFCLCVKWFWWLLRCHFSCDYNDSLSHYGEET